jgi:hypothetical protein
MPERNIRDPVLVWALQTIEVIPSKSIPNNFTILAKPAMSVALFLA